MKHPLLKKIASVATLLLLVAGNLGPGWASAAGASISLTANKSTVAAGGNVIIAIYMNGGGSAINAVQADISYPAAKLQYVGFSATGSAFEIGAASGGGEGTATIARGSVSSVSGSGLVGTVTFKALAASGSAAISVAGSSSLVSDGAAVAYGSSGVNLAFGASAPVSAGPATPVAPAPPKDTTPPVITAVKATAPTPFSATVTWTTNEPADSAVEYGLDTNYGLSSSASPAVTAHSISLGSAFLTPQTLLHYRVKSTDGAGNVATGPDRTLQLPGVPVTIIVRGANGQPQPGATVTLDGASGTTDSKGRITLPSSLGNKKITTTYGGVTIQKPITVVKTAKPLPPYQLDLSKKPLNNWMLTSFGLMAVVLTLLAIDAVLFGSRVLRRLGGVHVLPHRQPQAAELPLPPVDPAPAPVAEKPIEAVQAAVDDMLAVAEPPEPVANPQPAPLTTPLSSVDDIQLTPPVSSKPSAPPVPATPSSQKTSATAKPRSHSRKKKAAPKPAK